MRRLVNIIVLLFISSSIIMAQKSKLPVELKHGHLCSVWKLNDSIDAKVFLESGFPKIVFNESFINKYLNELDIHIQKAPDKMKIALWGNRRKYKVTYVIKDSLIVNGMSLKIDALVVDFSSIRAWKDYDLIYPVADMKGKVEINIKDGYMRLLDSIKCFSKDFCSYSVKKDLKTKGLYINARLSAFDTLNVREDLIGDFLLDLGAANAFILNKNVAKVRTFVSETSRMHLKDTTRFNAKGKNELSIIMPTRVKIDNIEINGTFIPAMKFLSYKGSNQFLGCIGNSFFKNFIVVFDYDKNIFYLKPNSDKVELTEY